MSFLVCGGLAIGVARRYRNRRRHRHLRHRIPNCRHIDRRARSENRRECPSTQAQTTQRRVRHGRGGSARDKKDVSLRRLVLRRHLHPNLGGTHHQTHLKTVSVTIRIRQRVGATVEILNRGRRIIFRRRHCNLGHRILNCRKVGYRARSEVLIKCPRTHAQTTQRRIRGEESRRFRGFVAPEQRGERQQAHHCAAGVSK